MRRGGLLVGATVVCVAAGCGGSAGTPSGSTPALVRSVEPRVVEIIVADGLGSGVIWDSSGHIVTNAHVVEGATKVQVVFATGLRVPGKVVARDPLSDLAVVQVAKHGMEPAAFATTLPEVGEPALAVGAPFGYVSSVSTGIVAGVHRSLPPARGRISPYSDMLQTTAPISPGNSGGALVNASGEVIGINTAGIPPTSGAANIGFAIPASTVRQVVGDLLAGREVNHPYLGARMSDLWPELQREFKTKARAGAVVLEVTHGSPAEKAGIVAGQVLSSVDGVKTPNADAFLSAIAHRRPGSTIHLGITTDAGVVQTKSVRLAELPSRSGAASGKAGPVLKFSVTSIIVSTHAHNVGAKGPSAGDSETVSDKLVNPIRQLGKPKGATVGTDRVTITLKTLRTARVEGVVHLPGGTLRESGALRPRAAGGATVPVPSGTGRYTHLHGYVTVTGKGRKAVNTFTLSRAS